MTIKTKDLKKIVSDYQQFFPGWKILRNQALVRETGPIIQGILFDRSSGDVYRPTGFIRVLTAPEGELVLELPQRLAYPNGAPSRSIYLKNHEKERADVAKELVRQIRPCLNEPLNLEEVFRIYEQEATTESEAYSLATLYAYIGNISKAREWTSKFWQLLPTEESDWKSYMRERARFLHSLEDALDNQNSKEFLENVIRKERQALGLQ